MIKVTINGTISEIEEGATLLETAIRFSPYGEESIAIVHNGTYYKSIDSEASEIVLSDSDTIDIVPLIIGG